MTRYTGLHARTGNLSNLGGPYNIELIGDMQDFEVNGQGETVEVPNMGNNYLAGLTQGQVRPEVTLTFHPQNTSYLHERLIVQTGNNLSKQYFAYYANSADYGILVNALPTRVEVMWQKNAPISVRATLLGTNWTTGLQTSTGNFSKATSSTEPMMSEQITHLRFYDGATLIRDMTDLWRRGSFNIDYKTVPVFTGTGITPSDVLEGVRVGRGTVEVSVNDSSKLLPYATNGSVLNVMVGMQVAPMSSCYYFYSSVIRVASITVPGVEVQRQRIEWSFRYITRSSL